MSQRELRFLWKLKGHEKWILKANCDKLSGEERNGDASNNNPPPPSCYVSLLSEHAIHHQIYLCHLIAVSEIARHSFSFSPSTTRRR